MFGQDEFAAVQAMQALVGDPAKATAVVQVWGSRVPPNAAVEKLVGQLASKELVKRIQAIQALAEMRDNKDATVEAHLLRAALKPDAEETVRLCAVSLLESYRVDYALLSYRLEEVEGPVQAFEQDREWALVYQDDLAMIYLRRQPRWEKPMLCR